MKLHTINPNGNLETINKVKLSLEEYSNEEVEKILKVASTYHVKFYLYSYETDMSDHEEYERNETVEITEKNMIIKDNKFYGCLGWTSDYYESLGVQQSYAVTLDKVKDGFDDSGGYNEFYYHWTLLKK